MPETTASPSDLLPGSRLMALRWGGLATQIVVVGVSRALDAETELLWPALVLTLSGLVSAGLSWVGRRRARVPIGLIGGALAIDIASLTALLALTGGPMNPFSFFYVVHLAIATVALPARWSWALVALSAVGYRLLFLPDLAGDPHALHAPGAMALHLEGMWVAFVLTAAFMVHFVGRLRTAMEEEARVRQELRALAERNQRLASLATLAGGAAHELATPLSTIAFAGGELEHALATLEVTPAAREQLDGLREDARLIRSEVARCRRVLHHMASDAGTAMGEAPTRVTVEELWMEALEGVHAGAVDVVPGSGLAARVHVPVRGLGSALRGLVKNGVSASPSGERVRIESAEIQEGVMLTITDRGTGMAPDVLARVGEPFFTTRAAGAGMGLGVFLARSVVEQAGGRLTMQSIHGAGTQVRVVLPLAEPEAGGDA
jgi:two-component system sensor histidine kinase RegB